MVSLVSLVFIAAVSAALATIVAFLRRLSLKSALTDMAAALLGTLVAVIIACVFYSFHNLSDSSQWWRTLGALALSLSPITAVIGLRLLGRRSIWRALLTAGIALFAVVAWLTLHLKGIRGGWTLPEIAVAVAAATAAVGFAACLGWWSKRKQPSPVTKSGAVLLLFIMACTGKVYAAGTLELTIADASSGSLTPARVELLAEDGQSWVPDNALQIFSDCGSAPVHNWMPWTAPLQALWNARREVWNPYTETRQFYVDGSITTQLPPGRYTVTATKGIEYEVERADFVIREGSSQAVKLELVRWIDLPRQGWYSADDHLHIPRAHPRFDPLLATWMQAEDIHVGNFLQMGLARDVHITPQYSFGAQSVYRQDNTFVVSGQENPRTHVLGHSIILGARQWIDFPQAYVLYDRFWRKAHAQGAVNGYAHWGLAGAEEGLAVWGHEQLLDFIEVLSFGLPFYDRWYETLNLGLRIGPTAGTDFPCLPGLPGRERFYTRLEGALDYDSWLEAVRRGKTFVTNGPVIGLTIDGTEVGGERRLSAPGAVQVIGFVRFDPGRDDVSRLELIRAGDVVQQVEAASEPGLMEIAMTVPVAESTWFALRAGGEKRGESRINPRDLVESMLVLKRQSNEHLLRSLPGDQVKRPSAAHTAAIWVTVDGTLPVAQQQRAQSVIQTWLQRLDELQARFHDDRMGEMAGFPGRGDGISEQELLANRKLLLDAITAAREHYSKTAME